MEKRNEDVVNRIKNEKTVLKEMKTNDRDICPLRGWKMEGGWCVNGSCEVLDDANDYR